MLVIILQIYTNSLQYIKISIETIFDQIHTYSLFIQIWYSSIFDHFPTSENFSIKFLFVHFLAKFGIIAFSIIFRHRKTFRSYSNFLLFTFDHFPTSIFDQIPTSVFDQILLSQMNLWGMGDLNFQGVIIPIQNDLCKWGNRQILI